MKNCLHSTPILTLLDLQQLFEIDTDASDYTIDVAYHSETLLDTVWKYPTYKKEMYSIVQACRQWKNYIMGKETIIHTYRQPLKIIHTQGKL